MFCNKPISANLTVFKNNLCRCAGFALALFLLAISTAHAGQPGVVYVDDNYAGKPNGESVNFPDNGAAGPRLVGTDAFATIQDAVDAVANPGTVNVAAGTYPGDVNVNKSLSIVGPKAGVNPNDGAWSDTRTIVANEAVIHGAVNLSLKNNIILDGFTLERTAANEGHILIGSGNPTGTGTSSSVEIRNDRFVGTRDTGPAWAGIHTNLLDDNASPGIQFKAQQNRIEIAGIASGSGILVNANRPGSDNLGGTTITANYVANSPDNGINVNRPGGFLTLTGNRLVNDDIFTFKVHNGLISGNVVINSPQGSIQVVASSSEDSSNVTVSNNTITNNVSILTNNFSQIDIRGPLSGTNAVTGNSVTLNGTIPVGVVGIYGVRVRGTSAAGVGNLTVSNNTLTGGGIGGAGNATFPPTSGVFVDTDLLTAALDLHIQNNFINGWVNAVSVFDTNPGSFGGMPAGATFALFNNNLSGNSFGVKSGSGELVNASCNWWGTNTAAGVAALNTPVQVDYTPWLDAGTDVGGVAADGFQGDFSLLHVDSNSPQAGAAGRIQEAVTLLANGALVGANRLVDVKNGTYLESNIAVPKACRIVGESRAGVIVKSALTDSHDNSSFSVLPFSYAFLLQSGDVTIQTLTIDGEAAHKFRGGVMTDHNFGPPTRLFNNITVQSVTVTNTNRRGIQIYSNNATNKSSGHLVDNCIVNTVTLSPAIVYFDAAGTISNNTVDSAPSGIESVEVSTSGPTPLTIKGNTLTNVNSGITLVVPTAGTVIGGPAADRNTVTTSGTLAVGVTVRNATGQVQVDNNQVICTGNNAGIWMFGNSVPVLVKNNILQSTLSSGGTAGTGTATGIFLSDDGAIFTDGNGGPVTDLATSGTITGNSITGFETGIGVSSTGANPAGGQQVTATIGGALASDSNMIAGTAHAETGVRVYAIPANASKASVTITNNKPAIHGNAIGIDVNGGSASITTNQIYDNTTGIRLTNGGTATVNNNDFEGALNPENATDLRLDSSAGLIASPLSGNTFAGATYIDQRSPQNFTALRTPAPGTNNYNLSGAATTDDFTIENRIFHKVDSAASGLVTWVSLATKLVFVTQPSVTNTAGVPLFTQPVVEARDEFDNRSLSFNGPITLTLFNNTTNAILSGTNTVFAASGRAVYTDLSVDRAGTGYVFLATSPGLAQDTTAPYADRSNPFNVATNTAPTLDPIGSPQTVAQNATFSLQAVGHDADLTAPENTLTYSLAAAPSWLSIGASSGLITGVAPNKGGGSVTVKVTDGGNPPLSATTSFTLVVTDVNDAPTLAPIQNISVGQGQTFSTQAVGSDIDPAAPNNTLSYSLVGSTPAWIGINSSSGAISGMAPNSGGGTATVQVTDGGGLFAQTTFTVTVSDTNNAPTIAPIPTQTVVQHASFSVLAVGSDSDPAAPNNTLTYSLVNAPAWVSIAQGTGVNAGKGVISGTAPNNGGGVVTVRVTDGGDPAGSAQTSFSVIVTDVNDAPTLAAIADMTLSQGQVLNVQAMGSDIDPAAPNNTLTYSLVGATPAWISINSNTGQISGTAPNQGSGTVTVQVTDGGGLFARTTFNVSVIDTNTAPTIAAIPTQTVAQGGFLSVTATGNGTPPLKYSLIAGPAWITINSVSGVISGVAPNDGGGMVIIQVTDGNNPPASAQTSFNVIVTDVNDAPTVAPIADVAIDEGQVLSVQAVGNDIDPAGPNHALTYSLVGNTPSWLSISPNFGAISGQAPSNGSGVATVRVTDGGGLFAQVSFTITVRQAPVVVTVNAFNNLATESGSANGTFTISRTNGSGDLVVNFTVSGTATEGVDYEAIGTSVTIPAGQDSVNVVVKAIPDTLNEMDESVILTLTPTAGYGLGDLSSAKVTLLDDDDITFDSNPTANPNPALAGQPVVFTASANSPGAVYTWDFGDGTIVNAGGTVTHVYTAALTTTVKLTVTGQGGPVSSSFTMVVTINPADLDSDGDGISDEIEKFLGTNPNDPNSTPVTNGHNPLALSATKLAISLNFRTTGKDTIRLLGFVKLPVPTVVGGQLMAIDVGGVTQSFKLNSKGRARVGASTMAMTTTPVRATGLTRFNVRLVGTFIDKLTDERLTNTTVRNLPVTVAVKLIFDTKLYQRSQPQFYTAVQNLKGTAK